MRQSQKTLNQRCTLNTAEQDFDWHGTFLQKPQEIV